ncbi:hypothetical protein ABOM_006027 [Aspergillus bombycis]|uniref:GDP/GTP exchange factor Sec2 N-terminal domain-containing protein n=1 Tax=Aspergillus bombycis TaxID=109264 RepID=A0A1F8A293_9EURO|nr:hypothetical protein ABOM_006027 [Aspergillus bombycis]OGM45850.1 hypothetical protein ABOM_006027 [Aspergillus bombycis]
MSTTTTTAALTSTTLVGMLPTINATGLIPGKNCPTCGQQTTLVQEHAADQRRIKELEGQISFLSVQAAQTAEKLANQANEMVAQERKARARLEERVAVLERRDVEKRTRLERLEKAMERVERIRTLVGQ